MPPSVNEKGAYKWIVKTQPVPFPIHLFQEPEIKEYTKIETNYQGYSVGQRNNEMAKYIGHLLAKIHPSEWENIALRMAKEANEKNSPPLSDYELTTTFNSIVNLEKRNKTDRWYQKTDEVETSVMWKESDNKIMLIKDIAAMNEYQVGDKYRTCYDIFDEAFGGGVEDGDLIVISGLSGFGKCH